MWDDVLSFNSRSLRIRCHFYGFNVLFDCVV